MMEMKQKNHSENGALQDSVLSLLSDIRAGKEAAFSRLVSQYDALLHARAAEFGRTPSDVADAYQEACFALHRAALHFDAEKRLTFGLYAKICIDNALKNWYRRCYTAASSRDPLVDSVPFEEIGLRFEFSDRMVEEEQAAALLEQITEALSPYEQRVFTCYIEGAAASEIARQVGRDEKSVRNALTRILRKLRKKLGRSDMPQ